MLPLRNVVGILERCKLYSKKNPLYLSINVLSTKVLIILGTLFLRLLLEWSSEAATRSLALCRAKAVPYFSVILRP